MKSMGMNRRAAGVLCVVALASCGVEQDQQNQEAASKPMMASDTTVVPTSSATVGTMGEGRDFAQESLRDICLKVANTIPVGQPYSAFVFNSSMSKDEVSSMLGYSMDAKAHFGLFDGSAKASFARTTTENTYSIVLYYSSDYGAAWKMLDSSTATWLVQPSDPNFYLRCGDQVLKVVQKGGSFLVQYKIDFSSLTDKQDFQASMSASYGSAGTVNADVKKQLSKMQSRASVKVSAYQTGGDPTQMFIGLGGSTGSDSSGASAMVKCASADLTACGTFMTNAVAYGTGAGTNQFPSNVKANPGDREYLFQDWSVFGGPVARAIPQAVTDARNTLLAKFNAQAERKLRLDTLSSGTVYVNSAVAPNLSAWVATVTMNLKYIQDAKVICYDNLNPTDATSVAACVTAASDAARRAKGYTDLPVLADLDAGQRVSYQAVRGIGSSAGWLPGEVMEGEASYQAGVSFFSAIKFSPRSPLKGGHVCYSVMVGDNGYSPEKVSWLPEVCDGTVTGRVSGTSAYMIKAIRMRLVGAPPGYRICYRPDVAWFWSPNQVTYASEACDNQIAGTYQGWWGLKSLVVRVTP